MKKLLAALILLSLLAPSVTFAVDYPNTVPFDPALEGSPEQAAVSQANAIGARINELTDAGQMVGCQSEGEFGGAVANALGMALQQAVTGTLLGKAQGFLNQIAQQAGPFAPLVNAVGGILLNKAATAINNQIGGVVQGITGQLGGQIGGQVGQAVSGLSQAAGLAAQQAQQAAQFLGIAAGSVPAVPVEAAGGFKANLESVEKGNKKIQEHANQLEQTEKALAYKECVSDPLIAKIKNALLSFITRSMLDWVNGGFDGGTAIIQNLRQFLYTGINAVTQDFIENQTSGICSPYRQDVQRIVLTQYQYNENYGRRSQCGVTTQQAQRIQTGEYNRQDFFTMAFSFNNDALSSYYLAQDEVDRQKSEYVIEQTLQYNVNEGYLDVQKCADGSQARKGLCADGSAPQTTLKGIHVKEAVDRKLGLADEQLLNSDEIGEIIDALMQSLQQVAFQSVDGLLGLSKDNGNQGSYLDQVVGQNVGDSGQAVQDVVSSDLQGALQTELVYSDVLDIAITDLQNTRTLYTQAIACYQPLPSTGRGTITPQLARDVIAQASSTVATAILPQLRGFERERADSETAIVALQGLVDEARTALTVSDVNAVMASFNALRQSGMLHNATDLQYLMSGLEAGAQAVELLLQDANLKLAACRAV